MASDCLKKKNKPASGHFYSFLSSLSGLRDVKAAEESGKMSSLFQHRAEGKQKIQLFGILISLNEKLHIIYETREKQSIILNNDSQS